MENSESGKQIYRENFTESQHTFTHDGIETLNGLINKIATGNPEATGEFMSLIGPWMQKNRMLMKRRLAKREIETDTSNIDIAIAEAVELSVDRINRTVVKDWTMFTQYFNQSFYDKHRGLLPVESLDRKVGQPHVLRREQEGDHDDDFPEPASVPFHEALPLSDEDQFERMLDAFDARESIQKLLVQLHEKLRDVLVLRFGLGGSRPHTLEEAGTVLGDTRERVRQREAKAIRKLQNIVGWESPYVSQVYTRSEADIDAEKAKNRRILWELRHDIWKPKRVLRGVFRDLNRHLNVEMLSEILGIPAAGIQALCNIHDQEIAGLETAVSDLSIAAIVSSVPTDMENLVRQSLMDMRGIIKKFYEAGGRR